MVRVKAVFLPVALAVASLMVACAISLEPAARPVALAAIFPPWWSGSRAVLAASGAGAVLRYGLFENIVVVVPGGNNAAARLRREGAWAVLDPTVLGACGAPKPKEIAS